MKIFDRYDDTSCDSSTELTKNYSDMRYELNKLSSLHHPHIVRFIGVFTNPHCFVLEWAPQKTLEHIRQNHVEKSAKMCTTSTFLVLLQVWLDAWYMHDVTMTIVMIAGLIWHKLRIVVHKMNVVGLFGRIIVLSLLCTFLHL